MMVTGVEKKKNVRTLKWNSVIMDTKGACKCICVTRTSVLSMGRSRDERYGHMFCGYASSETQGQIVAAGGR